MPYPDKLLAHDEEVVRHLHPHWGTVFWPVVRFLLIVGATSFGAAMIPAGRQQGVYRMVLVAVAVLLLVVTVVVPLLRWRTTHYVVTTHRLLFREGILARRGRDLGLARITDISYTQTLWERLVRSGTVTIETAGDGGATVLRRIPDSDGVQQLVNHMVEEDADRRAQESASYVRDDPGQWSDDGYGADGYDEGYGDEGYGDEGYGDEGYGDEAVGPPGRRWRDRFGGR